MEITTDRLVIRRFEPTDWQDLYEYLSDPLVVRFEPYEPCSQEQCVAEAARRAGDDSFYAVALKDNGKVIGNLYLNPGDFDTWELGYAFNSSYQGQGYATEATEALLDYAFRNLDTRRVVASCSSENNASWKLLERLNMRREGFHLQNVSFKKDQFGAPIWFDSYSYAILKSEWLS